MVKYLLVFFFYFVSFCIISQNEINISLNRSAYVSNTKNKIGFGFGFNRNFIDGDKMKVGSGIEFNYTNFVKEHLVGGFTNSESEVKFDFTSITLPITLRHYNSKTSFFEVGVFIDYVVLYKRSGTNRIVSYDSLGNWNETFENYSIKGSGGPSPGLQFGFGYELPLQKNNFLIKVDYKLGLIVIDDYMNDKVTNRYIRVNFGYIF